MERILEKAEKNYVNLNQNKILKGGVFSTLGVSLMAMEKFSWIQMHTCRNHRASSAASNSCRCGPMEILF